MYSYVNRLSSIGFFDIKPGLKRITKVLNHLEKPQNRIGYVLIAGTNGKGSVASILSSILIHNGYKTGLYTSPHLISVTERIKINNRDIDEKKLNKALKTVFKACEETDVRLSYFELVTAAAFVHFKNQKIDIGVLEVGMGGRWDATNILAPLVSIITSISVDHTRHLGPTTELIAGEKAEIIKKNVPAVSGVTGEENKIIIDKAAKTGSDLFVIGKDFNYEKTEGKKFSYTGIYNSIRDLSSNLAGDHQMNNSAIALAGAELLDAKCSMKIDFESIYKPLRSVELRGRFEMINAQPAVILDCAHNVGSADALINTLNEFLPDQKCVFLLGMSKDKDHKEFIEIISQKAAGIVVTTIPGERGADSGMLYKVAKPLVENTKIISDYQRAYRYIKSLNEPACITGSIYLIGLIKEYLSNETCGAETA